MLKLKYNPQRTSSMECVQRLQRLSVKFNLRYSLLLIRNYKVYGNLHLDMVNIMAMKRRLKVFV